MNEWNFRIFYTFTPRLLIKTCTCHFRYKYPNVLYTNSFHHKIQKKVSVGVRVPLTLCSRKRFSAAKHSINNYVRKVIATHTFIKFMVKHTVEGSN